MRRLLLALALIGPELAQAGVWGSGLSTFQTINVLLGDDATDGCWTNLGEVNQYAKDKLKLLGVRFDESTGYLTDPSATLAIEVVSERTANGLCYGVINVTLENFAVSIHSHSGYLEFSSISRVFAGHQNANSLTLDVVKSAIDELANPK